MAAAAFQVLDLELQSSGITDSDSGSCINCTMYLRITTSRVNLLSRTERICQNHRPLLRRKRQWSCRKPKFARAFGVKDLPNSSDFVSCPNGLHGSARILLSWLAAEGYQSISSVHEGLVGLGIFRRACKRRKARTPPYAPKPPIPGCPKSGVRAVDV